MVGRCLVSGFQMQSPPHMDRAASHVVRSTKSSRDSTNVAQVTMMPPQSAMLIVSFPLCGPRANPSHLTLLAQSSFLIGASVVVTTNFVLALISKALIAGAALIMSLRK